MVRRKVKTNNKQNSELLQLQKDWESTKKKLSKELSKEKDFNKKKELQLTLDYLENNYVDIENATISSKYEKKNITNFCGPKEFQATARLDKNRKKSLWRS